MSLVPGGSISGVIPGSAHVPGVADDVLARQSNQALNNGLTHIFNNGQGLAPAWSPEPYM